MPTCHVADHALCYLCFGAVPGQYQANAAPPFALQCEAAADSEQPGFDHTPGANAQVCNECVLGLGIHPQEGAKQSAKVLLLLWFKLSSIQLPAAHCTIFNYGNST